MRRIIALVAAVVLTLVAALPVAAKPGSCTVLPAEVPLGGTYTLTVTGLQPLASYWVILTQSTYRRGHHPSFAIYADASGSASETRATDTTTVTDPLEVGWVNVRVYPMGSGNKTAARCGFDVVP